MANLFDLLTNTVNKGKSNVLGLYNKLTTPTLMPIQLADNTDTNNPNQYQPEQIDMQKTFDEALKQPRNLREKLFGRTLSMDIENTDPETKEITTERISKFQPGFFNNVAEGAKENFITGFAAPNLTDNIGKYGKKGLGYRLGEGLGSIARIGESPLGRSLLVAGLVGATGGGALPALAYGAQTGMLNQANRNQDRLYRDDLIRSYQQSLENSPEFANLSDAEKQIQLQNIADSINSTRGYMTPQTYSNMIQSNQLRDNAAYRKMYYDAQQENNRQNQEFRRDQLAYQQRQDAINNNFRNRQLGLQMQNMLNDNAYKWAALEAQKEKNSDNDLGDIQQQLDNFQETFKDMPGKAESYTLGTLRSLTGTQTTKEANFNAQRTLLFNQIARKLGGEKGVLSDNDIKRIEAALPTLTDSYDQKMAKMKAVYDLLDIKKGSTVGNHKNINDIDPLGLGL